MWYTRILVLLGFVLVLGSTSQAQTDEALSPPPPAAATRTETRLAVFDEIWQTVRDHFYDPTLRSLDWTAVGEKYRPLAAAAVRGHLPAGRREPPGRAPAPARHLAQRARPGEPSAPVGAGSIATALPLVVRWALQTPNIGAPWETSGCARHHRSPARKLTAVRG